MGDDFTGDDSGVIDTGSTMMSGDNGFMGIFIVFFVIVVIVGIIMAVRKATMLSDAGLDPLLPVDAQLAAKVAASGVLDQKEPAAPEQRATVEERLAHLDDLLNRGIITAEERATARAEILSE